VSTKQLASPISPSAIDAGETVLAAAGVPDARNLAIAVYMAMQTAHKKQSMSQDDMAQTAQDQFDKLTKENP